MNGGEREKALDNTIDSFSKKAGVLMQPVKHNTVVLQSMSIILYV